MSGRSSSLRVCVLVLLTLVRPAFPRGPAASSPPQQGRDAVGEISWTLGLRLYRALRADKVQNPLFSPLLLASSLAALGGRAGGSTARQLQEALNSSSSSALPLSDQQEALSAALKSARAASEISFDLHGASAIFTKQGPALDPEFLEEARSRFLLEHVPLGPGDDLEALLAWAKAGVGGARGADPAGEIKAEPGALILAHALHFRGLWDRGFEEDKQDLRNFLGTKYTKVSMIHRTGVFRHHEDMVNMVQVVELPLWRGKASLVLLLPFHVEPLARLDRILTPKQLGEWLKQLAGISMAISLPRTTLTSTLNLQKHLSALGLTDAWDGETADFSGMAAQPGGAKGKLHLGGVLHWASLELSPEGGPEEEEEEEDEVVGRPKLFYADHSFIVMVKDNATGALLLMGALDRAEGAGLHDEL
ncbi:serine (or cysteine) peptidase inhibitor, clade H, member 2 [Anguilla rostrata]|uniref:serine (or cysteine) peptidase inhibitor, clade H, member 2 n=1 Tax=Anguilla rostrata TaxID=7938 RepID=UPI0030D1321F